MAAGKKAKASAPASAVGAGDVEQVQETGLTQNADAGLPAPSSKAPAPAAAQADQQGGSPAPAPVLATEVVAPPPPSPAADSAAPMAGVIEQVDAQLAKAPIAYPRNLRVMNNSVHAIQCRKSGIFVAAGGSHIVTLSDEDHEDDMLDALGETVDALGIARNLLAFAPA